MADLRVVKVIWNGATGLPGLSVFYSADPDDATASLGTWFTAIKGLFPTGMSWQIPSSGDKVDVATGQLTGGWTGGTAASIACNGSTTYAAGTGAFIRWGTGLIVGGRRLKGRTFLCPLTANQYDTDGTLLSASVTTINTATSTLVATNKLVVWHRPSSVAAANGVASTTTSGAVADLTSSLKTRRH